MSPHPRILEILRDTPGEGADHALLAALTSVDPPVQRECVRILIERGRPVGLNGLPPAFHRLGADARTLILANTMRLFGALRTCVKSSSGQTRTNTLDIVRQSANPRLAYLAASAVHDGSPKIRAEAAETLLRLTEDHCHKFVTTSASLCDVMVDDARLATAVSRALELLGEERGYLVEALREALEHYESHHRSEIVQAAMLMSCELESSLFPANTIKRGKLTHAMVEILSQMLSPRLAPFVYIALPYAELRRRLAPMLQNCHDSDFMAAFVRHHWLACDPGIRRHLSAIRALSWLDDGFDAIFNVPPDVAWRMPAWLMSLGLPWARKVSLLSSLLVVDNAKANRAAAWALTQIQTPDGTQALERLVGHEDRRLAQIARHELARRKAQREKAAARRPALRGRPPAWIALLHEAGLGERFDDFWQHFEHIRPDQARTAGRYIFEYVKDFTGSIQLRLTSQQAAERVRALRLMSALCVCQRFDKDIFSACNDATAEVRAAAVTALGSVGGETSRRILDRALNDTAPQVQAAAIGSLDEMEVRGRQELIRPKAGSEHADVRAAAVRSLLRLRRPEAATALFGMLRDERPEHRCAGLWVVDELRLAAIAPHILAMSREDNDPRIARIASHVARRLSGAEAPSPAAEPADPAHAGLAEVSS